MRQFCLLAIIFLSIYINAYSQPDISYSDGTGIIGDKVEILVDSNSDITLAEAMQSDQFKPSDAKVPNLSITDNSYWIRFSIVNNSPYQDLSLQVAHPVIDKIDFYELRNDSLVRELNGGDLLPFEARSVKHQSFIYLLQLQKGERATCYFHVKSGEQLMMPIYLGSEQRIYENALNKDILFGIYIGIILVMIFYNMFVYITVRDSNYLYYVIYLLSVLSTQAALEGFTFRFILPNHPFTANLNIYISSALIGILAIEFAKNFLASKQVMPKLHKGTYIFTFMYMVTIVLAIAGKYNISYQMILGLASTSAIYVLFLAVRVMMRGSRSAKYFLVAWSTFIVCVVIYTLKDFGVLPYNNVTNSALQFGSAFEAILLSFALADKINVFKKEKEKSQEDTLNALQENERILNEQNVMLETKVNERTLELQASNEELNKTLQDLKEAESQLVESEKMASLGQLTAGIAHEINNPINFVTSNVKPLKRDVEMMIDMISQVEEIGLTEGSSDEKRQKINALKQDYDFDYLKSEIDYLLKGINEGSTRTAEIVKGLRVFSRLDEDDLKKANINEGLDSTLIIINNQLDNKIEIVKEYGNIPLVECYPGKLNQVFLNIISNALHAIKSKFQGTPGGVLTIGTSNNEKHIFISLKDNGIGMDEKTQKKLFEPFFTTKDVGEGTGLGMSIAYNTIKKHNGNIKVNSELGVGTEFILEIPIVQ